MRLEDFVDLNPRTALTKGQEYPFVPMEAIEPGRRYVAPLEAREYKGGGARFRGGDTLFARITPCLENGKIAQCALRTGEEAFGSTEYFVLRAKGGVSDPTYVYYLALTSTLRDPAERSMSGASGRQRADLSALKKIEIDPPSLPDQKRIGWILSAYDDLIENNTRRIAILEEMAQAIYREWFVHFRFPGHENVPLVESELGPIPERWEAVPVAELVEIQRSSISPGDFPEESFAHFSYPAYDEQQLPRTESGDTIKSNKYLVDDECVLLGKLNPRFPKVWRLYLDRIPHRAITSTEFLVLKAENAENLTMLYLTFSDPSFTDRFVSLSLGTSGSHQRVKPGDFLQMHILRPPQRIVAELDDACGYMIRLAQLLRMRNVALRQTRDLLLPRLVSGQIDVSELDSDTGELVA